MFTWKTSSSLDHNYPVSSTSKVSLKWWSCSALASEQGVSWRYSLKLLPLPSLTFLTHERSTVFDKLLKVTCVRVNLDVCCVARFITICTWRSVKACNLFKSNTPPWLFFTFFKLDKYYQIAQHNACFVLIFTVCLFIVLMARILIKDSYRILDIVWSLCVFLFLCTWVIYLLGINYRA